VIIFGLVWFFRIKTGSNRFGLVFFCLAWFFPVWLGFFGLAWFFSGLGSIRFFWFSAYKTEPN
jgi:hypothetical protein